MKLCNGVFKSYYVSIYYFTFLYMHIILSLQIYLSIYLFVKTAIEKELAPSSDNITGDKDLQEDGDKDNTTEKKVQSIYSLYISIYSFISFL